MNGMSVIYMNPGLRAAFMAYRAETVAKAWRNQGRASQPTKAQLKQLAALLAGWLESPARPAFADEAVERTSWTGFLNHAWDAMCGVAPLPKDTMKALLLCPRQEVREAALRLAGGQAQRA